MTPEVATQIGGPVIGLLVGLCFALFMFVGQIDKRERERKEERDKDIDLKVKAACAPLQAEINQLTSKHDALQKEFDAVMNGQSKAREKLVEVLTHVEATLGIKTLVREALTSLH